MRPHQKSLKKVNGTRPISEKIIDLVNEARPKSKKNQLSILNKTQRYLAKTQSQMVGLVS